MTQSFVAFPKVGTGHAKYSPVSVLSKWPKNEVEFLISTFLQTFIEVRTFFGAFFAVL